MPALTPESSRITDAEQKSLTHGEFWIPEGEREVYREALEALNRAGVRYVVSGLYAIHAYTGVYRETKDLDLLMEPEEVVAAAAALREAGFRTRLEEPHWLAKALKGAQIDLIYGMANGIGFIDGAWYEYSRPGILAANQVRIAPAEELIWHRLFIGERHRFDMADVVHLILHLGGSLDWPRLLGRVGSDWRLLASQVHFFDYVYPGHRDRIPASVRESLRRRDRESPPPPRGEESAPSCRGTMLSLFSFAIDVNEWGFEDERVKRVAAVRASPVVEEISRAEVWDE